MSKQRRIFSAEFKCEAATLVLDQGYTAVEASQSLELVNSALRRWIKQLQQGRNSITLRARRIPPPEQQKLLELEARTNRLAREKAIFKKTTALLMSDELERTRS